MAYPVVIPEEGTLVYFNSILISTIKSLLENYEKAEIIGDIRDALLPRLISGKLRIPEAEAAVEEALQ